MKTMLIPQKELQDEIARCLLNGSRQTIDDVLETYNESGTTYVVIQRGERPVTYERREDPIMKKVPEDAKINRRKQQKVDAEELRRLEKLISGINGNFTVLSVVKAYCTNYGCSVYEITGKAKERFIPKDPMKNGLVHGCYVETTQANYVRA